MTWTGPQMGDAAFASGLFGTTFEAAAGYLDSPAAFHPWTEADWDTVPGPKLPVWVAAGAGMRSGAGEGIEATRQLAALGVPDGAPVAVDLETRKDPEYVAAFYGVLHRRFRVWPYGSASTLFANPSCNGYWVADYAGVGPFMFNHPGVRATQYEAGPHYDTSAIRAWTLAYFWGHS